MTTYFSLRKTRPLAVLLCAVLAGPAAPSAAVIVGQGAPRQVPPAAAPGSRIPADQLDSLVAPVALYPDPLLAQTLAASTYPLELMQLQQWLERNPALQEKARADAVAKQPWDPSVQAMAGLPDLVKRLTDDVQWTTDLGNAFLAQQSDVMDAVQRMRQKAQGQGNLASTPQQVVETKVVESKSVIVIEQANPETIYVPSYNPTVVYGPPVYPYPAISYPPPGYYAAGAAISFGVGVAMGAFWGGGGWGWNAGWGHNDININRNANFNRNTNFNGSRNGTWQHNAQHRGGAAYRDRATASRYGGTARGDSLANRQSGARQQVSRQGGNLQSGVGTSGVSRQGSAVRSQSGTLSGSRATGTRDSTNRARTASPPNRASGAGAGPTSRAAGSGGARAAQGGSSSLQSRASGGSFGSRSGGASRSSGSRSAGHSGGSRGGSRGGGRRR